MENICGFYVLLASISLVIAQLFLRFFIDTLIAHVHVVSSVYT